MKKIVLLSAGLILGLILNGQQIFVIGTSGFTFSPANVIVNQGDIVRFNVTDGHPVIQVSQSTWNANGTTALPGGFSFPLGSGDFTATTPGTFYYVCGNHASLGMKGTITVNGVSAISDSQIKDEINIFPNPAENFVIFQNNGRLSTPEIQIVDFMGRMVKVFQEPLILNEQVRLNIDNLKSGMYFIVVKTERGTIVKRFLKS